MFKGAALGFCEGWDAARGVGAVREGLAPARGRSVRVGFRTTARLPPRRVRVGSRPHVLPGGRAVCCFVLFV